MTRDPRSQHASTPCAAPGSPSCCPSRPRIAVGMGTCGSGNGAEARDARLRRGHRPARPGHRPGAHRLLRLLRRGAAGQCPAAGPAAGHPAPRAGRPRRTRSSTTWRPRPSPPTWPCAGSRNGTISPRRVHYGAGFPDIPLWNEVPFFRGQKKIVLRNCGLINPDDIEEYIAVGGYQALYKVLIDGTPEAVNEQIKKSRAARTRRRRLLHRREVGISAQGQGRAEVPDLQRRRRRSRRLHEPQRDRKRSRTP